MVKARLKPRFEVSGTDQDSPVKRVFKSRSAALNFADYLADSEVFDLVELRLIGGRSKFAKELLAQQTNEIAST